MKIAIGPCLFDWGKKAISTFYHKMAFETEADILYLGEVICSKRYHMTPEELGQLARDLKPSGKEIVFSTLGLLMTEGEQVELRQIAEQARSLGVMLEANDMGGIGVGEGQPLVAGPHINVYNPETLLFFERIGVKRVVFPVELFQGDMESIISGRKSGLDSPQIEIFAYGRLPLTFSARCYTARAFKLPKSNCQYKCGEFPDGMTMKTQDDQKFLTVNGVQTMSYRVFNLILDVEKIRSMGVDSVRLSPQSQNMSEIVDIWKERLEGRIEGRVALDRLVQLKGEDPFCNGYFHGKPGLNFFDPNQGS